MLRRRRPPPPPLSHFMSTCMLCLHVTQPHTYTIYVHTLPNLERVYAYCIHVRDNIRSEESKMQYLFLEALQLTTSHLPTPPAYTSASSKNSIREPSQSLSLFIDVCVLRKQSDCVSVSLSQSSSIYLSF